ncbi:sorting nexin-32 isoform X1 [Hydra vulgaris]|uniref:Sorting nexin n=1 Tax=Hydra vulgaris TaxID=6087 RepID=T2M9Q3_HYDVU|nr:sorting nexin-32 [Hydra vulgaris]
MMNDVDERNLLDDADEQNLLDNVNKKNLLNEDEKKRSESAKSIDLSDNSLLVDISDALSEKEKVKFTVHTKTVLPEFQGTDFSVIREHEEFIWLHDRFVENEDYAGIVIPPPPPRPDFDASREKLQKLSEGEGTMTKEEFQKMKQELESEYLATFKKTVAMHEVFLTRLAAHPVLRNDHNYRVFLEYKEDLSVRGRNTKDFLKGIAKGIAKGVDEKLLLSGQKDIDEFFENEKKFQVDFFNRIKDAAAKCDKMTSTHKKMADAIIKIAAELGEMGTSENSNLHSVLTKASESLEKLRKLEGRMATDEDLKLGDLLKYHMRDTEAAKGLLYRRMRSLANLENANKNLDKARAKNKDVMAATSMQQTANEKFVALSDTAKIELADLKKKKVSHFRKNLIELAELELKHAKAQVSLLNSSLVSLREM